MTDARDRLAGTLLGTALGDALGLPAEGLSSKTIIRRFGRLDRFRLLGRTGFVSDDTEQSALVAQSLARYPTDDVACVRAFRRALAGWFLRLPWGIGFATLRACLKILVGLRRTGVSSAGNGAAMRAAVVGTFYCDDAEKRRRIGTALAEVTHTDPRAVQGALFVAEVAAACANGTAATTPVSCVEAARSVVTEPTLGAAIDQAMNRAAREVPIEDAARDLGTTGFVIHTVPFATYCFIRFGREPLHALVETVNAGGDTDSIAAIVGAWTGALNGAAGLPANLLADLHDGPFGPTHLRALADELAEVRAGRDHPVTRYSALAALLRNLALYPVVLAHGFRRLVPW